MDNSTVPQITIGLGVIAAALVVGQYLVYKFIVAPERERWSEELTIERSRGEKLLSDEKIRSERLEAEIARQNVVLQEKALPALITATTVVGESQALLRQIRQEEEINQKAKELRNRN